MKHILILSCLLTSAVVYSQKQQEELAVAKVKKMDIVYLNTEATFVAPTLDLKSALETGFTTSNSKMIADYFAANIDVSLLDKENLYSKSQAEQVLRTFFLEHKPSKFTIIHQGKSDKTQYYIGALSTDSGSFRITVNVKIDANKKLITHLTIESDD